MNFTETLAEEQPRALFRTAWRLPKTQTSSVGVFIHFEINRIKDVTFK